MDLIQGFVIVGLFIAFPLLVAWAWRFMNGPAQSRPQSQRATDRRAEPATRVEIVNRALDLTRAIRMSAPPIVTSASDWSQVRGELGHRDRPENPDPYHARELDVKTRELGGVPFLELFLQEQGVQPTREAPSHHPSAASHHHHGSASDFSSGHGGHHHAGDGGHHTSGSDHYDDGDSDSS